MHRHFSILATILFGLVQTQTSVAAEKAQPTRTLVYKKVGDVVLKLHVFEPKDFKQSDRRAAIVFFFGGGWNGGSPSQFYEHSAYLASRGMVAMCAEYRVKSRNDTTPFECVKDGKSAVRFIRAHADEMGIDADKLAAGGGSAGGHVAAATATVPGLDEDGEDKSVSSQPNALCLFNPVYDNGPKGYGYTRVKDRYKEISPMHNIRKGMSPAIVFLGTKDSLIPVATGEEFQKRMRDVGSQSELFLYKDQPHGFFNFGRSGGTYYHQTVTEMDRFLAKLGYISGPPTLKSDDGK
ncbi:MAG: alpha/beta hydrolase fold domain-containing protein [Planctomycetota bacterium]|nr:alpha/beta hydrolase fold domain-containing protein [Planctomycetota bacterium]